MGVIAQLEQQHEQKQPSLTGADWWCPTLASWDVFVSANGSDITSSPLQEAVVTATEAKVKASTRVSSGSLSQSSNQILPRLLVAAIFGSSWMTTNKRGGGKAPVPEGEGWWRRSPCRGHVYLGSRQADSSGDQEEETNGQKEREGSIKCSEDTRDTVLGERVTQGSPRGPLGSSWDFRPPRRTTLG